MWPLVLLDGGWATGWTIESNTPVLYSTSCLLIQESRWPFSEASIPADERICLHHQIIQLLGQLNVYPYRNHKTEMEMEVGRSSWSDARPENFSEREPNDTTTMAAKTNTAWTEQLACFLHISSRWRTGSTHALLTLQHTHTHKI